MTSNEQRCRVDESHRQKNKKESADPSKAGRVGQTRFARVPADTSGSRKNRPFLVDVLFFSKGSSTSRSRSFGVGRSRPKTPCTLRIRLLLQLSTVFR